MKGDPHPAITASHADRRSTPRRLHRLADAIRRHRERRAYRRALARITRQYPTRRDRP